MRVETVGRVRENIEVQGRQCWTLFDTGSRNTYVVEQVASLLPTFSLDRAERVALGGSVQTIDKDCMLTGLVQGLPIRVRARVLPEIGRDEEGKPIEILLGALAMQEWGIVPIPHQERIDMTNYPEMFVEFTEVGR